MNMLFYYPPWTRPPALRARVALLPALPTGGLVFPHLVAGGGPVLGSLNPFQFGPAVIDPGEIFFGAGNPIGGPSEGYRGLSASTFPFLESVRGPGAPLSAGALGLAGSPLSPSPTLHGGPFL